MDEIKSSFELLHEKIQKWIFKQGWNELRPAQVESIKKIRATSNDLVICAPTASGKTEAAFLPLLSNLLDHSKKEKGYILYISPLKALINDQCNRLEKVCSELNINVTPWHGDISKAVKSKAIKANKAIIAITPESIEAMLCNTPNLAKEIFTYTNSVVLDEFHSFVGNDRGEQLLSLLYRLEKISKRKARKIALSATLGDLSAVSKALEPRDPNSIIHIDSSKGSNYSIKLSLKGFEYLSKKSREEKAKKDNEGNSKDQTDVDKKIFAEIYKFREKTNLIFPNSRDFVESIVFECNELSKSNNQNEVFYPHHSFLSKDIRFDIEEKARASKSPMTIACTSTLELGIDIGTVDNVFQVGPPPSVSSLRQRLGRSGRRDSSPILRVLIAEDPVNEHLTFENQIRRKLLETISCLSLIADGWYETPEKSGISLCIISHQILSLISQLRGTSAAILWSYFSDKDIYQINKDIFVQILKSLAKKDLIIQTESGLIHLSEKGENITNYYEFYSVFKSEEEYQLITNGRKLGVIPIRAMISEGDYLLFAGKTWLINVINNEAKSIAVTPSNIKGSIPTKGGESNIHTNVRKKMFEILKSEDIPSSLNYLDKKALDLLSQARFIFRKLGLNRTQLIGERDGRVNWYPWVGTRTINGIILIVALLTDEQPLGELELQCTFSSLITARDLLKDSNTEQIKHRLFKCFRDQEIKVLLPGSGKWTWTLSEDLQFHDALTREVNLDEAISTLINFDFEGQLSIGEKVNNSVFHN